MTPDPDDIATADLLLVAALYRERFVEGVSRDFYRALREIEIAARARLAVRIEALSGPDRVRYATGRSPTTARLRALIEEIAALGRSYRALAAETIDRAGRDLVPIELDFQSEIVERRGGTAAAVTVAAVIAAAMARPIDGISARDGLKLVERNTAETVRRTIRDGFVLNRDAGQIMADIMGRHRPAGDGARIGKHRRGAEGLVRTQIATQANEAMIATVRDAGFIGQLVTFDSRTSVLCRSIATLVQKADAPDLRVAPHHPRCRTVSYWMPTRGASVGGTRASKGANGPGQISTEIGLATWMRRQGRPFVVDSLGPARAKLFLDGGLKLEQFSDLGALRPLTLDELRRRHRAAFEQAGLSAAA